MKLIYSIIISLFIFKVSAQPLNTTIIKVNTVYVNNTNQLYFTPVSKTYLSISKKNKDKIDLKNGYKDYVAIPVNTFIKFVHNKDTMSIKILCPEYKNGLGSIYINKLNFKKGKFIIDLYEYVKITNMKSKRDFEIENFPEDCMAYIKEEEVKNKK